MSKAAFWDLTFFEYWMIVRDEGEDTSSRHESYRALAWWSAYAQRGQQLPDWKSFVQRPPTKADLLRMDEERERKWQAKLKLHGFSPEGKKVIRRPKG